MGSNKDEVELYFIYFSAHRICKFILFQLIFLIVLDLLVNPSEPLLPNCTFSLVVCDAKDYYHKIG